MNAFILRHGEDIIRFMDGRFELYIPTIDEQLLESRLLPYTWDWEVSIQKRRDILVRDASIAWNIDIIQTEKLQIS